MSDGYTQLKAISVLRRSVRSWIVTEGQQWEPQRLSMSISSIQELSSSKFSAAAATTTAAERRLIRFVANDAANEQCRVLSAHDVNVRYYLHDKLDSYSLSFAVVENNLMRRQSKRDDCFIAAAAAAAVDDLRCCLSSFNHDAEVAGCRRVSLTNNVNAQCKSIPSRCYVVLISPRGKDDRYSDVYFRLM